MKSIYIAIEILLLAILVVAITSNSAKSSEAGVAALPQTEVTIINDDDCYLIDTGGTSGAGNVALPHNTPGPGVITVTTSNNLTDDCCGGVGADVSIDDFITPDPRPAWCFREAPMKITIEVTLTCPGQDDTKTTLTYEQLYGVPMGPLEFSLKPGNSLSCGCTITYEFKTVSYNLGYCSNQGSSEWTDPVDITWEVAPGLLIPLILEFNCGTVACDE